MIFDPDDNTADTLASIAALRHNSHCASDECIAQMLKEDGDMEQDVINKIDELIEGVK